MRALIVTISLFALLATACGGTPAAVTSSPTQEPTVAAQTAIPQSTPTTTVAPTTTPRPTPKLPVLVEVTSDADVEELFVGIPATEVSKMVEEMTKDNFKVILPFDPHGVKFELKTFQVKHQDGDTYTIFVVKLLEGTATIKSYLPTLIHFVSTRKYGSETVRLVEPQDETRPVPGLSAGYFFGGGKGVYLEIPTTAEPLLGTMIGDRLPAHTQEVGKPIFQVSAKLTPIKAWPGEGHIVIRGRDFKSEDNASPIKPDSLLKRDGKIAYIN